MTEYIDYYINGNWDIEFTDWKDVRTARDDEVLLQNFVTVAASVVSPYVGENIGPTEETRIVNRIEAEYGQRNDVDSVNLRSFSIEDNTLSFTVIINSSELSDTVYVT